MSEVSEAYEKVIVQVDTSGDGLTDEEYLDFMETLYDEIEMRIETFKLEKGL